MRADGSLVCWDDVGSRKVLQQYDESADMSSVFTPGGACGTICRMLGSDSIPWEDFCTRCYCLSIRGRPPAGMKELHVMQVEPTILCNLKCPACVPFDKRVTRYPPPHNLPTDRLEKVLIDMAKRGIRIRNFDFSGHGEPLLNREIWRQVAMARRLFPDSYISICTNANAAFDESCLSSGVDEIVFAIDGVDQESYAPYRVDGDYEKAYGLMSAISRGSAERGAGIRSTWKYILFRHNSSPEHLSRLWKAACEAGVGELQFNFTHVGSASDTIRTSEDLGRILTDLGVPSGRILVRPQGAEHSRARIINAVKRHRRLCELALRVHRSLKSARSGGSGRLPLVTCKYYVPSDGNTRDALALADNLSRRGRPHDSALVREFAERMQERNRTGRQNAPAAVPGTVAAGNPEVL
jgi:hypothetical protein